MKAAIRDSRKAFSPAANENARQTSDRMLAQVPNNSQVRERYRQVLELLEKNLDSNDMPYRVQQVLNFFILQGRINTRLVFFR